MREYLMCLVLGIATIVALLLLDGCDTGYHYCRLPDGGNPPSGYVCDYPDSGAAVDGE